MKRTPKPRSIYTIHNLRKLSILVECFNFYKTSGQVSINTHIPGESLQDHKNAVAKTISRLRNYFIHPYLTSHHLIKGKEGGHIAYKCTPKGKKVCCELFYRKIHLMPLNWNGRYHVFCVDDCAECEFNPTLTPNYREIIETPDTRPIKLVVCPCGYKRTFRVNPDDDEEIIKWTHDRLLKKHYNKEHACCFKHYDHNDCKNTRTKRQKKNRIEKRKKNRLEREARILGYESERIRQQNHNSIAHQSNEG